MGEYIGGWAGGWMNGWMDGQTDTRMGFSCKSLSSCQCQEVDSHFSLRKFLAIPHSLTKDEQKTFPANVLSTSIFSLNLYFPLSSLTYHRILSGKNQYPRTITGSSDSMKGKLPFLCLILRMWSYPPGATCGVRASVKTLGVFSSSCGRGDGVGLFLLPWNWS